MQKIACVFSFKESNWVSCQKIVFNLHKAYQACPNTKLENFNFSHEPFTSEEVEQLAKSIYEYGPDVISMLDHKPHPLSLIQKLNKLYQGQQKPKIIFHLFGDFTIYYHHWEKLGLLLEGFPTEFLVASDRQKILVDRMLKKNECIVCPFPVEKSEFYPDSSQRELQRKKWKIAPDEVAFIFTGRLSRQKKIKSLITSFAEEFQFDSRAHLFIYGAQDNIGDPFVGIYDIEGEYFRVFYKAYKALPIEIQKQIHFMGPVPNAELLGAYQGADVFMNLSVHNDEDYGMSVAEAQFTGLPIGLTDWGGLASFYNPDIPESTSFIPVRIGKRFKQISLTGVRKVFRQYMNNPMRDLRESIAKGAHKRFSVNHASSIISNVITKDSSEFGGYTELFFKASHANLTTTSDPMYLNKLGNLNNLYKDIYSAYVRND
jgi:glycosyltransferase involved in cell wall biosynthesis